MIDVRLCIPWGFDFKYAKSGLRDLELKGAEIRKDLIKYKGYTFAIEPRFGSPMLARLRNSFLVDKDKKILNFRKFHFVDSDIVWCIDNVVTLLNHNVDVCCAPYLKRNTSIYECGMWKDRNNPGPVLKYFTPEEKGFKPIDFTGIGFFLFDQSILEKMDYPYFRHVWFKEEDGSMEQTQESRGFCHYCYEKNIKIWCDFDIHIEHKPKIPTKEDWII